MQTQIAPIRLLIADDHEFFRQGFKTALQQESSVQVIAEAANGKELLGLVKVHNPDIVFMDIKMPLMNGLETTKILTATFPQCAVIALSSYDEHYMVDDMFAAGAIGYLLKDADKMQVLEAISAAMQKQQYFCNAIRRVMNTHNSRYPVEPGKRKVVSISPREAEVLILICEEKSNFEIAEIIGISKRTVEGFRRKLYAKTKAQNEAGLAIYAIDHGIYRR